MEARLYRAALVAAAACCLGAGHRTQNFVVTAATQELAVEIAESAERCRRDLAVEWLGAELPPWQDPCPITAQVGPRLGASGVTQFMFDRGRPFGWTMSIQGSRERTLDSVLPHEITHTIFATHFGRPLPRWADEGACTTVEHMSERNKQQDMLITFLTTNRGIAFNKMFAMKEYPHDVMPLYSQGHSVVQFLLGQGGKQKFVRFVGEGMHNNNWTAATQKHYGFSSLSELQLTWVEWVRKGSPALQPNDQLAAVPNHLLSDRINNAPAKSAPPDSQRFSAVTGPARSAAEPSTHIEPSSRSSGPGWYAKQRDIAISNRGGSEANPADSRRTSARDVQEHDPYRPQMVTRPQPIGRPQQTIIEWSRKPENAPSTPQRQPGAIYEAGQSPRSRY